jgi:hypothetical protein
LIISNKKKKEPIALTKRPAFTYLRKLMITSMLFDEKIRNAVGRSLIIYQKFPRGFLGRENEHTHSRTATVGGTTGNMEQLGTWNIWEHGTVGNMEQVGLDIYCTELYGTQ